MGIVVSTVGWVFRVLAPHTKRAAARVDKLVDGKESAEASEKAVVEDRVEGAGGAAGSEVDSSAAEGAPAEESVVPAVSASAEEEPDAPQKEEKEEVEEEVEEEEEAIAVSVAESLIKELDDEEQVPEPSAQISGLAAVTSEAEHASAEKADDPAAAIGEVEHSSASKIQSFFREKKNSFKINEDAPIIEVLSAEEEAPLEDGGDLSKENTSASKIQSFFREKKLSRSSFSLDESATAAASLVQDENLANK